MQTVTIKKAKKERWFTRADVYDVISYADAPAALIAGAQGADVEIDGALVMAKAEGLTDSNKTDAFNSYVDGVVYYDNAGNDYPPYYGNYRKGNGRVYH